MSISITIDKKDMDSLRGEISERIKRFKEMGTPLGMIAVELYNSVQRNFREEGTDKEKWQPLSQFTLWVKRVRKSGKSERPKILQDKGYLRQSIVPRVGENFAQAGTNLPYARLHQVGGVSSRNDVDIGNFKRNYPRTYKGRPVSKETIERREGEMVKVKGFTMNFKGGHNVPARPFLVIRKDNEDRIMKICERWFFNKD